MPFNHTEVHMVRFYPDLTYPIQTKHNPASIACVDETVRVAVAVWDAAVKFGYVKLVPNHVGLYIMLLFGIWRLLPPTMPPVTTMAQHVIT